MSIANDSLKSYFERAEHLENDRINLSTDVKELYKAAKSAGYDPKIMRKVVKLRKIPKADRQEADALLESYMAAAGE